MLRALWALMILPGLSTQQRTGEPPQLPPSILERVYAGHDSRTGLVRDDTGLRAPRLIWEQTFGDDAMRLLLVARFPVDPELRIRDGGADSKLFDLVLVNGSGEPVATGLNLFQFDGHSGIKVDVQPYPNLRGRPLVGILDQHVQNGVDGWTLHLVRLTPVIHTVLRVPALFSDCGAPLRELYPDRIRKKAEVVFSEGGSTRVDVRFLEQTCEGKEIRRTAQSYIWNERLGEYSPISAR